MVGAGSSVAAMKALCNNKFVSWLLVKRNESFKKGLSLGGSDCGSVGRAVAYDTRGPQFESSDQQKY